MKKCKLIRLKLQLLLLRVTTVVNIPFYLQLLWAALEKIFKF
jgi:hypothetical protein